MTTQSTALATDTSRTLRALVDAGASHLEIASHLDALSPTERLAQVMAVRGKRVGMLYKCVAGAPALTFEDVVPAGTPKGATVIHQGRNSLPLFSSFQKRFSPAADGTIVGYNHQTFTWVTGPGYFVLTSPDATHPGELVMDYTREPSFTPDGWPAYRSNDRGFSKLVFAQMKDYCRRVAGGVLVGAAFTRGKARNEYFTLVRMP